MSKDLVTVRGLLRDAAEASMVLLVSLFLSYNTYKEYMRSVTGFNPYTPELKSGIKAAFPASIIIFFGLYIAFSSFGRLKNMTVLKKYLWIIPFYLFAVNFININGLYETLIVLNVSVIYLPLLLIFLGFAKRVVSYQGVRRFVRTRPAESALYSFVLLMIISALLTLAGVDKQAAKLSIAAFFLFVAGLSFHIYKYVKNGGFDAKED